jgi:putative membrane protein
MSASDSAGMKPAAPTSTELALERTWLAHERTLMAWVRTATSMIGFGFTIYKFFQFEVVRDRQTVSWLTPRDFALIMIGLGLVTLLLATISRRIEIKDIALRLGRKRGSLSEIVAGLIFMFGIVVLLATAFHG